MRGLVVATLALAVMGAGTLQGDVTWRWHGAVAAGKGIEIKGINGSIKAERASGTEVEVVAVESSRRGDVESVDFEVVPSAEGITICAVYPTPTRGDWGRQQGPNYCAPGDSGRMNTDNNDVKVEWTVRVPAGVSLRGRTVNGGIDAMGLASDADLLTVNGAINVSTTQRADAATINGDVDAKVGRTDWVGGGDMRTLNGSIHVTLPSNADVAVSATVLNGGRISADVPVDLTSRSRRRRGAFTYGRGKSQLSLGTMNGTIVVRRAP
jgi:DUF4097 and DUF4098 domain-containing protein YvlB